MHYDILLSAYYISANAADNNAFWFVAIAIFKAVDAGMAIYDSYQLVQELTSEDTTEERKKEIAQELVENGVLSIGGGRSVKKLLDVVEEKLGISKETLLNKIKDLLPNKGPKLETAGGPRLDGRDHDTDPNMYNSKSKRHNDADISTTKVNTQDAKVKGSPEYEALNNPAPNTRYELDNGTTFKTNSGGHVEEITFTPINKKVPRDGRQTQAGKEGLPDDVGGHIQACSYGGTCDRFNLFPQNKNFNGSAFKKFENVIRKALKNGDEVGPINIKFDRHDPNSARPDRLTVEYRINGIVKNASFKNEAGVEFEPSR